MLGLNYGLFHCLVPASVLSRVGGYAGLILWILDLIDCIYYASLLQFHLITTVHTFDSWIMNLSLLSRSCTSLQSSLLYPFAFFCRILPSFESEAYVTSDGQSASLSGNKAPIWGLRPDFYYCQTVAGLSDERTGLSFAIATGPRQLSHFRVRVPWD
jgi:hypothetical protein